jgi:hypothetical protein
MFFVGLLLGIVVGACVVKYSTDPTIKMLQQRVTDLSIFSTRQEILIGKQFSRCIKLAEEREAWREAWKKQSKQLPDSLVKLLRTDEDLST